MVVASDIVIELKGISKSFGKTQALQNVELNIEKGKFMINAVLWFLKWLPPSATDWKWSFMFSYTPFSFYNKWLSKETTWFVL